MAIIINIDVMMARRKVSLGELAERVDITPANLSILKSASSAVPPCSLRRSPPGTITSVFSYALFVCITGCRLRELRGGIR